MCLQLAVKDESVYIWIDTYCFGKSSHAEMSKATNSFTEYYRIAQVCYAYPEDLPNFPMLNQAVDWVLATGTYSRREWTLKSLLYHSIWSGARDYSLFFSSEALPTDFNIPPIA